MIWKWICRVYFQQVKSFIVNLGIKLRIRYFNKIKLNVSAFLSFNTFSLLKVRFDTRSCSLWRKIPHMCKTLCQGVMFAAAVATWCPDAPPGGPPLARTAKSSWPAQWNKGKTGARMSFLYVPGQEHLTQLSCWFMVNRPFFLRAIFRSVSLNPGHKNITRLFCSSKSTDHSIKQSAAVDKDDKHSAACCASIFS